ncbi:MAG: hypothetical protein SF051_03245, partial [Elusimicrobiota bacterium]|nr:hypothetical protein [Elusimicrobiota bacterium]
APAPRPAPEPARVESAAPAPAPARPTAPAKAPSLWNGLVKPMAGASAAPAGDEAAAAAGSQEYDGGSAAPALAAAPGGDATLDAGRDAVSGVLPRHDALFVSIELDPGEAGTLRDAVAGLGVAGFSQDHRFEPRPGPGGASIVTGWLPAARLGDAVVRPGVRRVSIETSARPAPRAVETEGAFLLGLRVPDTARPHESIVPALDALARDAGLKGRRVLGLETAPDGRMVAVVSGRLPLARLSKALMRPDVVKLVPAPAPDAPVVAAPAPAPAPPTPGGFAKFVARRGLWLVVLTVAVALLLPGTRAGVGRGLNALVPYH